MTCHDAREQFSALVDDVLSADERATLDAHLATCADCRRELQRFRDTVGLLGALAPARAPAGFVDRVLEASRPVPWPRRLVRGLFLPWPVKLPMEAAAIVMVAVGVGLVYRGTPEIQEATRLEPAAPVHTSAPASPAPQTTGAAQETDARIEYFVRRGLDEARDQAAGNAPEPMKRDESTSAIDKKTTEAPPLAKSQPAEARSRDTELPPMQDRQARQEVGGKLEARPPDAERERAPARESARSQPAPAARADAQAPRSAQSVTTSSLAPPDVSGRLAVGDRELALRGVGELAARLGAVEHRRFDVSDGQMVELTVPREAYAEFVRELGRLGRWQPSAEPSALPAQIRVFLRITS
jgi:Putative zinc-finger